MATKEIQNDEIIKKKSHKSEKISQTKDYSKILTLKDELVKKIENKLQSYHKEVPNFWEKPICEEIWVPVEDGKIRILHVKPKNPINSRPVLFIPGWSTFADLFDEFYQVLHDKIEFYYIETREKKSSLLDQKKAKMDLSTTAKDVQTVIDFLGLKNKDFELFGTCWGASIILQGLLDQSINAPTVIVFSPMHKLWMNRFLLKYVIPIMPKFLIKFLLKIIPSLLLLGDKATTQKRRTLTLIKRAVVWKWKKAAIAAADFELFGKLHSIKQDVIVVSGTHDRVHDINCYPRIADEMPNSRFFYFGIDESDREYLMGFIVSEFAKITKEEKIPIFVKEYEKIIH